MRPRPLPSRPNCRSCRCGARWRFPLTLQPLAVNRPMSVEAVNTALAGDRLVLLVLQKGDDEEPSADALHDVGTIGIVRQMARGPQGLNIIVEGMARARVETVAVEAGMLRAHAGAGARAGPEERRSRCLRPPDPGTRRSGAVADLRSGARGPSARGRHRRSDAPVVPARHDARPEGRGKAAAARSRPAAEEARARALAADARSLRARAQRQDRVAGAAGDDRRAEAVLPAPAAEGDSGGARRRRRRRDQGPARARRGGKPAGVTCKRSPTASSIAWRAWDRRRPSRR